MTRNEILAAIRRAAAELGRAPSRGELRRITGISHYKVLAEFPTLREAVRAVGLEPNPKGEKIARKICWPTGREWRRGLEEGRRVRSMCGRDGTARARSWGGLVAGGRSLPQRTQRTTEEASRFTAEALRRGEQQEDRVIC